MDAVSYGIDTHTVTLEMTNQSRQQMQGHEAHEAHEAHAAHAAHEAHEAHEHMGAYTAIMGAFHARE